LAISVTALGGGKGGKNFHDGKMVDVFDCPGACRDAENRRRMTFVKQIPPNTRGFFAKFPRAEIPILNGKLNFIRISVFFAFPKDF
jgi:hypothetical protein